VAPHPRRFTASLAEASAYRSLHPKPSHRDYSHDHDHDDDDHGDDGDKRHAEKSSSSGGGGSGGVGGKSDRQYPDVAIGQRICVSEESLVRLCPLPSSAT
jgi:hypothetical protein